MAGFVAKPLEPRLLATAQEIQAETHADIGSDHARLPRYLLETGRVRRVVVVEKNQGPLENSRRALQGLNAEVRRGGGLAALKAGEADSLSLTGMGAKLMVRILAAHPARIPPRIVVQPNDSAEPLRRWALDAGLGLLNEQMVEGFWRYTVLSFGVGEGSAYRGLPMETALRFGPILLRQKHPLLKAELYQQRQRLRRLKPVARVRLELDYLEQALALLEG
jgi:tRNA (adenine22-N1)-methyltransferase